MWNTEQRIAYRYDVTSPVPVYTDLGPFEIIPPPNVPISNEIADGIVAFAFQQWTNVETSSFQAQIVGDFGSIGLPDINSAANTSLVIGADNGGGIHVIYDANGTILRDFFGVPPNVLGIASPEWADESTGILTESWVVINAQQRWVGDNQLLNYAGVFTHEIGHAINLAHSQTNGAIAFSADAKGPAACADSLPYPTSVTTDDIETMYPFINARPGTGSGIAQSTVEGTDDKSSLSNLYPAPGYLDTRGSISGRILQTNGNEGITGVNVIARNLDSPYSDAVSAMSGDYVRVAAGNDGSFTLTGLTPGAHYALYTDSIVLGGFPTVQPFYIPGPEEFYNGAGESGNGLTDDRCQVEPITAVAGSATEADIILNSVKGAPSFVPIIGPSLGVNSITSDGSAVAGGIANGPAFRWTEAGGIQILGNTSSVSPKMSRDGSAIVGEALNANGVKVSSLLKAGSTWQPLPLPAGSAPCGSDASFSYGVSAHGNSVSGYAYFPGCKPLPFLWTAATGTQLLPTPASVLQARPNNMSDDGSTIVGWWVDGNGFGNRTGVRWVNGQFLEFSTPEMVVGEATNTNPDGSVIVGRSGFNDQEAWRWTAAGGLQEIGRLAPSGVAGAFALSDDGNVVAGLGGMRNSSPLSRVAFLWTPELGMVDFEQFLRSQGTFFEGWVLNTASSISADGTIFTGGGFGPRSPGGWVVKMDKVNICHAPPGNPANARTINIPFRHGMQLHLDHGDTIGVCTDGGDE